MAFQIVFCWNRECEKELKKLGFKKTTVYLKEAPGGGITKEQIVKGDSQFFKMRNKPYQFVTTSFWGAGAD